MVQVGSLMNQPKLDIIDNSRTASDISTRASKHTHSIQGQNWATTLQRIPHPMLTQHDSQARTPHHSPTVRREHHRAVSPFTYLAASFPCALDSQPTALGVFGHSKWAAPCWDSVSDPESDSDSGNCGRSTSASGACGGTAAGLVIASHSGGGSGSDIWSRRDRVASMRPSVSRMHTTWGQNRSERHTRPLDQTGSDVLLSNA